MKRVYIFRWSIPLGRYPGAGEAQEARGEKVFSTDAARQEFIRAFGAAVEIVGIMMWSSYSCSYDCEVL